MRPRAARHELRSRNRRPSVPSRSFAAFPSSPDLKSSSRQTQLFRSQGNAPLRSGMRQACRSVLGTPRSRPDHHSLDPTSLRWLRRTRGCVTPAGPPPSWSGFVCEAGTPEPQTAPLPRGRLHGPEPFPLSGISFGALVPRTRPLRVGQAHGRETFPLSGIWFMVSPVSPRAPRDGEFSSHHPLRWRAPAFAPQPRTTARHAEISKRDPDSRAAAPAEATAAVRILGDLRARIASRRERGVRQGSFLRVQVARALYAHAGSHRQPSKARFLPAACGFPSCSPPEVGSPRPLDLGVLSVLPCPIAVVRNRPLGGGGCSAHGE